MTNNKHDNEIKKVNNVLCMMCGQPALYLARTNNEPLCGKCTIIDEQLNFQKGKIDKHGNETKTSDKSKTNKTIKKEMYIKR